MKKIILMLALGALYFGQTHGISLDEAKSKYQVLGNAKQHPRIKAAIEHMRKKSPTDYLYYIPHFNDTYLALNLGDRPDEGFYVDGRQEQKNIFISQTAIEKLSIVGLAGVLVHEAYHVKNPLSLIHSESAADERQVEAVKRLGGSRYELLYAAQ